VVLEAGTHPCLCRRFVCIFAGNGAWKAHAAGCFFRGFFRLAPVNDLVERRRRQVLRSSRSALCLAKVVPFHAVERPGALGRLVPGRALRHGQPLAPGWAIQRGQSLFRLFRRRGLCPAFGLSELVPALPVQRTGSLCSIVLGAAFSHCQRAGWRSEEHTSELQSREKLVCRLLLEKKNSAPQVERSTRQRA